MSRSREYAAGEDLTLKPWSRLGLTEVVTHLGTRGGFHDQPRFGDAPGVLREFELSMVRGRRPVEEAVRVTFRRPARPRDRARYFVVMRLGANGYRAFSSPRPSNVDHVSVVITTDERIESDAYRRLWDSAIPLSQLCEPEEA